MRSTFPSLHAWCHHALRFHIFLINFIMTAFAPRLRAMLSSMLFESNMMINYSPIVPRRGPQTLPRSPHHQQMMSRTVASSSAAAAPPPSTSPVPKTRIGVIGAGQMGEALIRGFLKSGAASPGRICASVASFERRELLSGLGIGNIFDSAASGGAVGVAQHSDVIFLGVKPQAMGPVLEALRPVVEPHHLIISIAAGIKLSTLESALNEGARVVRVMPNTPCLVQSAASAYALGTHATQSDADLVSR